MLDVCLRRGRCSQLADQCLDGGLQEIGLFVQSEEPIFRRKKRVWKEVISFKNNLWALPKCVPGHTCRVGSQNQTGLWLNWGQMEGNWHKLCLSSSRPQEKTAFKNKHTNNKIRNTTSYLLYTEVSMKLTCNIQMKCRETRCPESWRNSEALSNAKKTHWGNLSDSLWWQDLWPLSMFDMSEEAWPLITRAQRQLSIRLNVSSSTARFFFTKYWKKLTFLHPVEVEIRLRSTAGVTELTQVYSRISISDWIPPKWHLIEWMWLFLCFPSVNIVFIVRFLTCRPHRDA